MARKGVKVLLGFEDECITEKHKSLVNYTTNKIGGKPEWPVDGITSPVCKLCGLPLPLVVQIYAPLENNPHHRTLYLFGCVNPNCWNQSESWTCIRSQILEVKGDHADTSGTVNTLATTDWCSEADDWDDDNNVNNNEENGNIIRANETSSGRLSEDDDDDDDDEETEESYDDDIRVQLGQLNVNECNANWDEGGGGGRGGGARVQEGGAVGRLHSPSATAEIEGDESEIVSIDTPTAPQHNLLALLQEVAPLPVEMSGGIPQFAAAFISVGEDEAGSSSATITPISEHVRDLLQEYQQKSIDEGGSPLHSPQHEKGPGDQLVVEKYEKSVPAHGDKMFYHFVSRIQQNPGQILRYCREGGAPLWLYPEPRLPSRCQHCRGEVVCELQLVPTLVSRLQLVGALAGAHLEFGTVLVFCCKRSCWAPGDKNREEAVVVQAERI